MSEQIIVYTFSRKNIEVKYLDYDLNNLQRWIEDPDLFETYLHRVFFIVDGYDDDERDLSQIPEVVNHIRALNIRWPYFINFALPQSDSYAWWVNISYLTPVEFSSGADLIVAYSQEHQQMKLFQEWFANANQKVAELGIKEQLYISRQKEMIHSLTAFFDSKLQQ